LIQLRLVTAFVVTRNKWRDEMITRNVARYNWKDGKWDAASRRVEKRAAVKREPGRELGQQAMDGATMT
jgi:hypothetical protein